MLEKAFKAWRKGELAPAELLSLQIFSQGFPSSEILRSAWLRDQIFKLCVDMLDQRRIDAAPDDSMITEQANREYLGNLRHDFDERQRDERRRALSALYYRYLIPFDHAVSDLAQLAGVSERTYRRYVILGLDHLTEALLVMEQSYQGESAADGLPQTPIKANRLIRYLPPQEYLQLFGVRQLQEKIMGLLTMPDGPRFISLEGLGGVGKTALAQWIAWRCVERDEFIGVLWSTAKQERLGFSGGMEPITNAAHSLDEIASRLAQDLDLNHLTGLSTDDKLDGLRLVLQEAPYLVVIDNLETLQDVDLVINAIFRLAGKSRFLITSRVSLARYSWVMPLQVPELSLQDGRQLFLHELGRHQLDPSLDDKQIESLYHVVGGLPLVLKLVAAQMRYEDLATILDGMTDSALPSHTWWDYIYRHSWDQLDDDARRLLISMYNLPPDGETFAMIRSMSSMTREKQRFHVAFSQLLNLSLLEINGSRAQPVYRLHHLTVTFIESILHGQSRSADDFTSMTAGSPDSP